MHIVNDKILSTMKVYKYIHSERKTHAFTIQPPPERIGHKLKFDSVFVSPVYKNHDTELLFWAQVNIPWAFLSLPI